MRKWQNQEDSSQRRGQQTNAQFWSNQPDPVLIERDRRMPYN